ncbi:MAG: MYXO-CTERM sorting domain-containing protein [Myxococcales bacterium]|nr:MYXO-CTERM sorting domain-containing protein [Myxococcota bacterium]MDW8283050.1 MYXO-CTERM sorting domain-containing protein [Myxococcales bacterium]
MRTAHLLSLLLLVGPASASRPVGTASPWVAASGPRLLVGALSGPQPGVPAEEVARRYLEGLRRQGLPWVPQELGPAQGSAVGPGQVLRWPQQHRGLPVRGGELSVRVTADGRIVRLVREVLEAAALVALDPRPQVPAEAAMQAVAALERGTVGPPALEIDQETGRPVWAVPCLDGARLENAIYLVDAHTGQLLRRIEQLRFADWFRVFRPSPAVRSEPERALLPGGGLFSPLAHMPRWLTGQLLRATSCIDEGTSRPVPGLSGSVHLCVPRQLAAADAEGNYDAFEPLVGDRDGRCPHRDDAQPNRFAEAHMYWHAAAIYDRFRQLYAGLGQADVRLRISTGANPQPLGMVANLCIPDTDHPGDVTRPLRPLDNAFFSPGGQGGFNEVLTGQQGDALGFGMGTRAAFALDGDVIYHEFTHAVVHSRGRLTAQIVEDDHGLSTDPGAINEALADYFSSALAGDGAVGEYAGRNFSLAGGLRNLDNRDHCSDDRIGQIHHDSQSFSGALWQARRHVASPPEQGGAAARRRDVFDQAVLAALEGSGPRPSMTEMAELVLQEVALRADQLGPAAQAQVEAAFVAHGILPACDRVIRGMRPKPLLCLDGIEGRGGRTRRAGHVQWRIEVPATADGLLVELEASSGGCAGPGLFRMPPPPLLQLAVAAGEAPIRWQRDEGSYDELVMLEQEGPRWRGQVPVRPGVYHVMVVNAGGSAIGRNIRFSLRCQGAGRCQEAGEAPGCGCRMGGVSGGPSGAWLVAVGMLGLRRRRRPV